MRAIEFNGYLYEIIPLYESEIAEHEALEIAKQTADFLSSIEIWNQEKIIELAKQRKVCGIANEVKQKLYDAYYDLCFYGNMEKSDFLHIFNLSERQLAKILI